MYYITTVRVYCVTDGYLCTLSVLRHRGYLSRLGVLRHSSVRIIIQDQGARFAIKLYY